MMSHSVILRRKPKEIKDTIALYSVLNGEILYFVQNDRPV